MESAVWTATWERVRYSVLDWPVSFVSRVCDDDGNPAHCLRPFNRSSPLYAGVLNSSTKQLDGGFVDPCSKVAFAALGAGPITRRPTASAGAFTRPCWTSSTASPFAQSFIGGSPAYRADLDPWLRQYNEGRTHRGRWCHGETSTQTFLNSSPTSQRDVDRSAQSARGSRLLIASVRTPQALTPIRHLTESDKTARDAVL